MDTGFGLVENNDLDAVFPRLEFYHVEWIPGAELAMMPSSFIKRYYHEVFGEVVFVDSYGKERSVFLSRADGKSYLTAGWVLMGGYYDLEGGGLFRIVYISHSKKKFQVFNTFGDEVYGPPVGYPLAVVTEATPNPVVTRAVPGAIGVDGVEEVKQDAIVAPDAKKAFCHILTKVLTYPDLSGEGLLLPSLYCDSALKPRASSFKLIDEDGREWKCGLRQDRIYSKQYRMYYGWDEFRRCKGSCGW